MKPPTRILYVDSDRASRESFDTWLKTNAANYTLVSATGAAEALSEMSVHSFDLYLLEYGLDDLTGPDLCRRIKLHDGRTPVVICSPLAREVDRNTAIAAGAAAYVVKPDDLDKLAAMVRHLSGAEPRPRRRFQALRRCSAII